MTNTATIAGAISMVAQLGMLFGAFGGNRDNNNNRLGTVGSLLMLILAPIAAMIVPDGDQPYARIRGRLERVSAAALTLLLRRLEKAYGKDIVRAEYERLAQTY